MHHICLEVIKHPLINDNYSLLIKVTDIYEAIKSLEGKVRPLNPEPKVSSKVKVIIMTTVISYRLVHMVSQLYFFIPKIVMVY